MGRTEIRGDLQRHRDRDRWRRERHQDGQTECWAQSYTGTEGSTEGKMERETQTTERQMDKVCERQRDPEG